MLKMMVMFQQALWSIKNKRVRWRLNTACWRPYSVVIITAVGLLSTNDTLFNYSLAT